MWGGFYIARYISDDGMVFNTEYECCEYEQHIKKTKENERIKKGAQSLVVVRMNRRINSLMMQLMS